MSLHTNNETRLVQIDRSDPPTEYGNACKKERRVSRHCRFPKLWIVDVTFFVHIEHVFQCKFIETLLAFVVENLGKRRVGMDQTRRRHREAYAYCFWWSTHLHAIVACDHDTHVSLQRADAHLVDERFLGDGQFVRNAWRLRTIHDHDIIHMRIRLFPICQHAEHPHISKENNIATAWMGCIQHTHAPWCH